MNAIEAQTGYNVLFNKFDFDPQQTIDLGRTDVTLQQALDQIVAGSSLTHAIDGKYIIIHNSEAKKQNSSVAVANYRTITGRVTDATSTEPLEGVRVEVLDIKGKAAKTFANGRFRIEGVPSGNYVAKLTTADGGTVRYREIRVPAERDADVNITLNGELLASGAPQEQAAAIPHSTKTTAYYVPNITDNTTRAFTDDPKTNYSLLPEQKINGQYLPKAGIKSNLLYLAATSPNLAVEFSLAPKWTLDASLVFNPFQLEKGGVNRFWFAQPEFRYWFCQRFEKHFIGLHGIYGQFNIGEVSFLSRTFEDHRYKGWGAGAGISYGYHLPMGKRWGWEFTVGAGVVYYEYDRFRCYGCDDFEGRDTGIYLGPTKAGISLIYMIK